MTRYPALVALILLAALAPGGRVLSQEAAPEPAPAACSAPQDLIVDVPRFPVLAHRFRAKLPVTIVVIGGASTAGTAAGEGEANAYPHRLEEALRRRHPGVPITVINKGIPRQSAEDMVARFAEDVLPHDPNLVIWETGTVDAVRGIEVADFADAIQSGASLLRQHKAEIMLVDMQYNPRTSSIIDFSPYIETMRQIAELEEIYVFRRYDIMRYWSDQGSFDLVNVPKGKQAGLAEEIYRCLGERMADAIDYAAR
ncbi:MAG: SGNH/GDSL hydrolase family protein [Stellaceae bacterium]